MINLYILTVISYFLGAIPFAQIIAKAHGIDLRTVGSGNIGATNLSRAVGKKWAYFCFALDVLKGFAPMFAAGLLISDQPALKDFCLWLAVGFAAIIGHIFPIYLKFKGGKGVATSFGVALGLWPYFTIPVFIAFIIWIITVLIWRYVSLSSIIASVAFPVIFFILISLKDNWKLDSLTPIAAAAVLIPIMVIVKHKDNIKRLLAGTENKIMQKK